MAIEGASAEEALMRGMGLDEATIERRRRYVALEPDDLRRIASVRALVESHAADLTKAFFDYLSALNEAKLLFDNRAAIQAARQLKHDHLLAMVSGDYDVGYVQQRLRLARIYSGVGLDLRVFIGAFQHLMRQIGELIVSRPGTKPHEGFEAYASLQKVGAFDISIISDAMIFERERVIRRQEEAIREISTPVLQLRDRLLLLPLVGIVDSLRARQLTEGLLSAIRSARAKAVVMDITGVAAVDSKVANHLIQTVAAARLMGATVVITGLSAEVAQALVAIGVDFTGLNTVGDLQGGIEEAERLLGLRIVAVNARNGGAPALRG